MFERQDGEWVELRRARDRRRLEEAILVLAAAGVPHRLEMEERKWRLLVPAGEAPGAQAELARYEEENRQPIQIRPRLHIFDTGWVGVLAYLLLIWLLPNLEGRSAFGWHWREIGLMDAELVRDGQWWRAITALTLHADLGHLAGNSFFGALFGLFVGRFLGTGFGWLLVLLGGFLGNLANAWLQTPPFASLGASTATFAALGLTGAFVWRRGFLRSGDWRRNFAPLFAAIALLAYTGIGGERTDVLGHFLGFAAGALGGLLASSFDIRRLGKSGQWIAGVLALWLVAWAWLQAGSQGIPMEPNGAPTAGRNLMIAHWSERGAGPLRAALGSGQRLWLQRSLEAGGEGEQRLVPARMAEQVQARWRLIAQVNGNGNGAGVEEVGQRGIAQRQEVQAGIFAIVLQRGQLGGYHGRRGVDQRRQSGHALPGFPDHGLAGAAQVDEVRRRLLRALENARAHPGIVPVGLILQMAAMPSERLSGGDAALGVDAGQLLEGLEIQIDDLGAQGPQAAQGPRKGGGDRGV